MMLQTMVYPMRVIYLLPYFAAITAGAFTVVSANSSIRWRHMLLVCMVTLLLSWEAGVSLIKRPLLASHQSAARQIDQILELADAQIGRGPIRVLMVEWEFYYAARELGWEAYKLFGAIDRSSNEFRNLLESMDYVIFRERLSIFKEIRSNDLKEAGFELVSTNQFRKSKTGAIDLGLYRFSIPETIYDDVSIYRNSKSVAARRSDQ
jgi:hypothetical protein